MADIYLEEVRRHLEQCERLLKERTKKVSRDKTGLTTYEARVSHTLTMYHLVQELRGVVMQDPDHWADEPDIVPF